MAKARAAALTNYAQVAESVGLDPDRMLARAGLSREMLSDRDRLLDGGAVGQLLEESAHESGCITFGLMMAEARPVSGIGAVSLLVNNQATLREAANILIRYQQMFADTLLLALDETSDGAMIRVDIMSEQPMTRQAIEMTLGELCLLFVALSGGEWRPEIAHFGHPAPGDLTVHRRVFACPLEFGCGFNGLGCSSAALDKAIPGADPALARYALGTIESLAPGEDGAIAAQVRRALYQLLPTGRGALADVSAELGLQPRTLQRLLMRNGSQFGTILDAVRRELAMRHLLNPACSIETVGALIGFATPSSFSRWFGTQFGMPAGVWRAGQRYAPTGPPAVP